MSEASGPIHVSLQLAVEPDSTLPAEREFSGWVNAALSAGNVASAGCVTIRIVDESESTELNSGFREKDKPTNVLAFPAGVPLLPELADEEQEIGDLVICQAVVIREAAEQGKQAGDHFAHLAIHGSLHLAGYDHQDEAEASTMEALEVRVMQSLGFSDPYQ